MSGLRCFICDETPCLVFPIPLENVWSQLIFWFCFPKDQKASYDFNDMDADPKPRDSDPDNWFVNHLFMDFFC